MQSKIKYQFTTHLWRYPQTGGWVFASVPTTLSKEIRENFKWQEEGWGRLKTRASIDGLDWETAIWFDKKRDTYLLPIKAEIRNKKKLELDIPLDIIIWI